MKHLLPYYVYDAAGIKPCPFCGGHKVTIYAMQNELTKNVVMHIHCANHLNPFDCTANMHLCLGKEDTVEKCKEQLIEKWNTRNTN